MTLSSNLGATIITVPNSPTHVTNISQNLQALLTTHVFGVRQTPYKRILFTEKLTSLFVNISELKGTFRVISNTLPPQHGVTFPWSEG